MQTRPEKFSHVHRCRGNSLVFIALVLATGCQDGVRGKPVSTDGGGEDTSLGDALLEMGTQDSVVDSPTDGPGKTPSLVANISSEIAVDDKYVYAIEDEDLVRIPKAGGIHTVLARVESESPFVLDDTNAFVHRDREIALVPKTGGEWLRLTSTYLGLRRLAVDNQYLYFADSSGKLYGLEKTGSGGTQPISLSTPFHLEATENAVFWTRFDELDVRYDVMRHETSTGTQTVVGAGVGIIALAALGDAVVWLDWQSGIRSVEGSSEPIELVGVEEGLERLDAPILSMDETHVYWASHADGSVYRALRAGGPQERVAGGYDFPVSDESPQEVFWDEQKRIDTDDEFVYWSDAKGIYRVHK